MTFPAVQGRTYTSFPGPTADYSHAVTLPSGIVAGELLLVIAHTDGAITAMSATSGWTELFDSVYSSHHCMAAYWKIAEGSDSLTISFTGGSERINYCCWRISGAKAAYASTAATGSSDYPDPPNLNPGVGTKDFLWIAAAGYLSISTTAYAAFPSGYSNTRNAPSATRAGTVYHLLGVCEKEANASAENPGNFSGHVGAPSENWIARTIAISPASKGGAIFMGAGL